MLSEDESGRAVAGGNIEVGLEGIPIPNVSPTSGVTAGAGAVKLGSTEDRVPDHVSDVGVVYGSFDILYDVREVALCLKNLPGYSDDFREHPRVLPEESLTVPGLGEGLTRRAGG